MISSKLSNTQMSWQRVGSVWNKTSETSNCGDNFNAVTLQQTIMFRLDMMKMKQAYIYGLRSCYSFRQFVDLSEMSTA